MTNMIARWAPSIPPTRVGLEFSLKDGRGVPAHLRTLGGNALWQKTRGAGVRIALLDSGVSEIDGLFGQADYLDHEGNATEAGDDVGHGTACASLIASKDRRAPGIAPEARLTSIRIADLDGKPDPNRIVMGLDVALALECDIVSCSFVLNQAPAELLQRIQALVDAGVVVTAAAGNDADIVGVFPEETPGAVVVGALDGAGTPLADQRMGVFTDVFAPGEDLDHIDARGRYSTNFGHTSGATALVAGVAALVLSRRSGAARRALGAQFEQLVRRTAKGSIAAGDGRAGLINGLAMLNAL